MKKVVKFGGSSLASAEQFKKVGAIISADESRVYVVPSAPGKRFPESLTLAERLSADSKRSPSWAKALTAIPRGRKASTLTLPKNAP